MIDKRRLWTDEQKEEVRALIIAGHTAVEIGVKLGRTPWAIQRMKRRFGMTEQAMRPVEKSVPPSLRVWCFQCDRMVFKTEASSCTSQWCSANSNRAAA